MIKVAINGFGRIGRLVFRELEKDKKFDIVAINDLSDPEQLAYLLKYDTNHGSYKTDKISFTEDSIVVGRNRVLVTAEKEPAKLPWKELDVDLVFECTGLFTDLEKASAHIEAGAKKVLISAPAKGDLKTIVYNVNHETLTADDKIVSAASCTTNCLAPTLDVVDKAFGVISGYMTTVHAYTNDQSTLDVSHKKGIYSRRGRAAAENIVPASTGAASAVGKVLPNLKGKLDGMALRVPVSTGSVVDLTLRLKKGVTKELINEAFEKASNETIGITMDPIVSSDIKGSSFGALVDGQSTSVLDLENEQLIKLIVWYDNEMGYSVQMVRTAEYLMSIS